MSKQMRFWDQTGVIADAMMNYRSHIRDAEQSVAHALRSDGRDSVVIHFGGARRCLRRAIRALEQAEFGARDTFPRSLIDGGS